MARATILVAFAVVPLCAAFYSDSVAPGSCPAGSNTSCDATSTCCSQMFSYTGYGCCKGLGPNAVCCGQQGCCPAGYTCLNTPPYSSSCVPVSGGSPIGASTVCTPGPLYPPSHGSPLPSAIAIGDSVSIGYTPAVIAIVNGSLFLQHSPYAGGGGADDTGNGLNCLDNFIRTSDYSPQAWDVISFNFGLHNLDNASSAEALYGAQLSNITAALKSTGAKLLYVTTTPYMPARYFGDMVVEQLNAIATGIMASAGVPVADLYTRVTDKCGAVYSNCSICDDEYNNATGVYCGYHYTPEGYQYLAEYLAPFYTSLSVQVQREREAEVADDRLEDE